MQMQGVPPPCTALYKRCEVHKVSFKHFFPQETYVIIRNGKEKTFPGVDDRLMEPMHKSPGLYQ